MYVNFKKLDHFVINDVMPKRSSPLEFMYALGRVGKIEPLCAHREVYLKSADMSLGVSIIASQ